MPVATPVRRTWAHIRFVLKSQGNDLSTPHPEFGFEGLQEGDRWCLCAARWLEAYKQEMAPNVILANTHQRALEVVPLELLQEHAVTVN